MQGDLGQRNSNYQQVNMAVTKRFELKTRRLTFEPVKEILTETSRAVLT